MADAIRTEGLTRRFGSLAAVEGLDLRVRAGQVFGYLGPNGAGKTTTLHLLLGILPPSAGRASVAGIDVAQRPDEVRKRVGALLETHGLYERLSARANLELVGRMHGLGKAERDQRTRAILESIGLWDRRDDAVGTWSRGMKQQLAIGRTLLHRPEVVFLDEPTAGFDPAAAANLRERVRRLAREEGTTVFLTTHNLREAEQLCDQVAVLAKGRLLAVGPPDQLRRRAPVLEVQLARLPAKALAAVRALPGVVAATPQDGILRVELATADAENSPVVAALVKAGAAVEGVRRAQASLEEEFLALVGAAKAGDDEATAQGVEAGR